MPVAPCCCWTRRASSPTGASALVVRWAVLDQLSGAAAAGCQGFAGAGPLGLVRPAQFDRPEDYWPLAWAEAYLDFVAGEKPAWLHQMGHRSFPVVGWAERGDGTATGHGNSVPRFHITWGTGPGLVAPFAVRVHHHHDDGRLTFAFRHQVDGIVQEAGAVVGVHGTVLALDAAPRGEATNRTPIGSFTARGQAVIVTSGGIGGNLEMARAAGHPTSEHGRRGSCTCGRSDAVHLSGRRGTADQRRPDVALRGGTAQLGPDLGQPRHPHPDRPLLPLAGRGRPSPARPVFPGLRHPRHAAPPALHRLRLLLVRAHPAPSPRRPGPDPSSATA